MTTAPSVPRSTLRLSEVARHVVIPEGIEHTLWHGWDAGHGPVPGAQTGVLERCRDFGVDFDVWQDGIGQATLGIRADGHFAATVGGITFSIPRQVAKTFLTMCIVLALCTLCPNLTVLWTAHRTRTATNTFQKMAAFAKHKRVRKYLLPGRNNGIRTTNGEQEIAFRNGSKIMFGAREQGFGRGFDEVDIEVFDEAQILTEKALEDMVAATNQSRWVFGALLFFMGTPPRPTDPGQEFSTRRKKALARKRAAQVEDFGGVVQSGDAVYVECSADPDVGTPDGPSLDDRAQVELANPSYPHRTPDISIRRLRENLTNDDSWKHEGLGVWDGDGVALWQVIGEQQWDNLAIDADEAPAAGEVVYAVKFSSDGERVGAGAAVRPAVGPVLVEAFGVVELEHGTGSLVAWLTDPARVRRSRVVIDGKAGAGDLAAQLVRAGLHKRRVHVVTVEEAITAHATMLRAVREGGVVHSGQPGLRAAVRVTGKRPIGKAGGFGWQPVTPDGDTTAFDAVTLALGEVTSTKRSRIGDGEVVIA